MIAVASVLVVLAAVYTAAGAARLLINALTHNTRRGDR